MILRYICKYLINTENFLLHSLNTYALYLVKNIYVYIQTYETSPFA